MGDNFYLYLGVKGPRKQISHHRFYFLIRPSLDTSQIKDPPFTLDQSNKKSKTLFLPSQNK